MADKTVKLKHPITIDEKEYIELTFPEHVKLKHFRAMPVNFQSKFESGEMELGELIPILAGLTDVPAKVIEEVDFEDLDILIDGMKDFF